MKLQAINSITSEAETMSSREIAELTFKRHDHVLRDCDKLNENYSEMNLPKIGETSYIDSQGREYRQYLLTKIQTFDLMTGYHAKLRIRVNRRWEELEKKQSIDFSDPKNVLRVVQKWVESEEQRKLLKARNQLQARELKEAAPKVDYYEKVIQSDQAIRTTVIAKDLGMSAGRLNRLLYEMGIQYKVKDTWVLYAKYEGKGYTKSVTHHFTGSDGKAKTSILTCWTQKGREFILEAVPKHLEKTQSRKLISVS